MKILDLPLKKEWYNMIESGIKPEEYRDICPYWIVRLLEIVDDDITGNYVPVTKEMVELIVQPPDSSELLNDAFECCEIRPRHTHVRFRYGYTKRTMLYEIDSIRIGRGNPKWGAPTDRNVFIIKFH